MDDRDRVASRWDGLLSQLAVRERRFVILSLIECDDTWLRVPEDVTPPGTSAESAAIELHHVHLPALAADEFVEWRAEPLSMRRGPRFDEIAAVVRVLMSAEALPSCLHANSRSFVDSNQ